MVLEADAPMHRIGLYSMSQLPLAILGSLASLASGSVSTALVALFHREEPELIVIACSTILSGLIFLALCLLPMGRSGNSSASLLGKFGIICIQLVILGASVYYLNFGRKHGSLSNTQLHSNLLVALDSLILSTLFLNGLVIGSWISVRKDSIDESREQKSKTMNDPEKYIPLKNSSQTLTPGMEFLHTFQSQSGPKTWNLTDTSGTHSSDEHSFPSVVKHKLEYLSSREASPASTISRKASSISLKLRSASDSPKTKGSIISKLCRGRVKSLHNNRARDGSDSENKNINGRYVTRLSTIPDLSRSVLNFMLSSSDNQVSQENQIRPDRTASQIMESSHGQIAEGERTSSGQALDLERNAIERINSALLPPCLRIMETPPPAQQTTPKEPSGTRMSPVICQHGSTAGVESNTDTLEGSGLGKVPRIPMTSHDNGSDLSTDYDMGTAFPQMATMEMWQENKDTGVQRPEKLHEQVLLPAFDLGRSNLSTGSIDLQTSAGFSFPSKIQPNEITIKDKLVEKDLDTISALEEYFRDVSIHEEDEEQIMQNGLKQDFSSSMLADRVSKELMRTSTRHSPTKSMISVLSAASQQRSHTVRNSYLNMSNDAAHLQNSYYITSPSNAIINATKSSSPTRSQRLKRIGKKLSLSNISDTMTNHSFTSDATGEFLGTSKHDHMRGRSIDFSYVHNLQSTHSPTKSTSGTSMNGSYKDRRNSLIPELAYRAASGPFYLQNGNSTINHEPDLVVNSTFNEQSSNNRNSSSSASTNPSQESTTRYPEVVMSEYDRERWNSILNLKKVDSHGQLKA